MRSSSSSNEVEYSSLDFSGNGLHMLSSLGQTPPWDIPLLKAHNISHMQILFTTPYIDRRMSLPSDDDHYYSSSSSLEVLEGDQSLEDDYNPPSTGYLEDVLFGLMSNGSSKRRRLQTKLYSTNNINHSHKNCWDWDSNLLDNYSYCAQDLDTQIIAISKTTSDTLITQEMKTPEEETFSETHEYEYSFSSPTSYKQSSSDTHWTSQDNASSSLHHLDPVYPSGAREKRKTRVLAKVVYPFAVVKPGGYEGDVTLNDINERILMPPTRPVRHPVGDFACRPLVSPDGPGLFGKAVIAFTRIQTQGRGTITIIRTRG